MICDGNEGMGPDSMTDIRPFRIKPSTLDFLTLTPGNVISISL